MQQRLVLGGATGPALIYVGFLMLKGFTEIDFTDFDEAIGPCVMMMFTAFTGSITVTVIEVLANGNLLVSGEKQVSIGAGTEYIRLSGIVNPYFISTANTISSTNVADARIEYKESGIISEAQVMGWLARFFMSVLPF